LRCFNEQARIHRASIRADADRALLDAVAAEGLTGNRLAVRLGISRQGAWQRKRAAERRQAALQ